MVSLYAKCIVQEESAYEMISIAYCSPFFPITCVMSEIGSVVRNSSRTWNDCAENLHTLSSKYCETHLKSCHWNKTLNGDVFDRDLQKTMLIDPAFLEIHEQMGIEVIEYELTPVPTP